MDFFAFLLDCANTLKKLNSTDARIYMLRQYETKYGIFNHSAGRDPNALAELRMHWEENTNVNSTLTSRRRAYVDTEIHKWFGLNFSEFISHTRAECIRMLEDAAKFRDEDLKAKHAEAMRLQNQVATDKQNGAR